MKAYIIEKTEQEAVTLAKKLLQENKIKSYTEPRQIVSHISRKTRQPIYKYQIECEE